jgi:hypothetical protein
MGPGGLDPRLSAEARHLWGFCCSGPMSNIVSWARNRLVGRILRAGLRDPDRVRDPLE